jgi:hypothetical protein
MPRRPKRVARRSRHAENAPPKGSPKKKRCSSSSSRCSNDRKGVWRGGNAATKTKRKSHHKSCASKRGRCTGAFASKNAVRELSLRVEVLQAASDYLQRSQAARQSAQKRQAAEQKRLAEIARKRVAARARPKKCATKRSPTKRQHGSRVSGRSSVKTRRVRKPSAALLPNRPCWKPCAKSKRGPVASCRKRARSSRAVAKPSRPFVAASFVRSSKPKSVGLRPRRSSTHSTTRSWCA